MFAQRRGLYRASDMLRCADRLMPLAGFKLSSDPYEFSNINTADDLLNPKPRPDMCNRVKDDILLTESSQHFHQAAAYSGENLFNEAAQEYLHYSRMGWLT